MPRRRAPIAQTGTWPFGPGCSRGVPPAAEGFWRDSGPPGAPTRSQFGKPGARSGEPHPHLHAPGKYRQPRSAGLQACRPIRGADPKTYARDIGLECDLSEPRRLRPESGRRLVFALENQNREPAVCNAWWPRSPRAGFLVVPVERSSAMVSAHVQTADERKANPHRHGHRLQSRNDDGQECNSIGDAAQ